MSLLSLDNITDTDLLNRKIFAKQIVTSLTSSFDKVDESMVIGICGKWGSGKSTLLKFIEGEIADHYKKDVDNFRIVNFNPWSNTGVEDLQRSLLETLLKELQNIKWKNTGNKINDEIKKYLKYLEYVKFVKYAHPVAGKIFDTVEQYTKGVTVNSLDDLKIQVNKLITEKEIKLYILVDDLDRLDHSEITGIFKTIKLNVNFLNTYFLIAYDKQVVINALTDSFKNNAEGYLEKIIQVDFAVPEIREEQIESMFFDRLNIIFERLGLKYGHQAVYSIWKYKGLREYFRTPRDIKRFFNSLALSLPTIASEINLLDYLVLEAVKVFDYSSYEKIYQKVIEIKRKAVWQSASFNLDIINEFKQSTTKALLGFLFIENAKPLGDSINKKRLRDPEFFDRYFSLHIRQSDITEEVLVQFLSEGTNKRQLLNELLENERMGNFLRRLADTELSKSYQVSDYTIFKSFLDFWDEHGHKISSAIEEDIWNSYFNLAHSFGDKHKAAKIAVEQLEMSESAYQPMRFIFNHFIVLFQIEQRVERQFHSLLKVQIDLQVSKLEHWFKQNINTTWGSYLNLVLRGEGIYPCNLLLYSFAKHCRDVYLREVIKNLDNHHFLLFLLKNNFIMYESGTKKFGRVYINHKDLLLPEILFETFINNLRDLKTRVVSEADEEIITLFLRDLQNLS